MPLEWAVHAQTYADSVFGEQLDLYTARYAIVFSSQNDEINKHVLSELKKKSPHLRLALTSPFLGYGFDSPCVTDVIHAKPTRSIVDFVQQIGRAGRLGQRSFSTLYYNSNDIASNSGVSEAMREYCTTDECLWRFILKSFGFYRCKIWRWYCIGCGL